MYNPLWAPIAVAAGRELALSALPNAPVIADERRRVGRPVCRASGWLDRRAVLPLRVFAEQRDAV